MSSDPEMQTALEEAATALTTLFAHTAAAAQATRALTARIDEGNHAVAAWLTFMVRPDKDAGRATNGDDAPHPFPLENMPPARRGPGRDIGGRALRPYSPRRRDVIALFMRKQQ